MMTAKYFITAGITAAVLALTACSGGKGSSAGQESQKTETQKMDTQKTETQQADTQKTEAQNPDSKSEGMEAAAQERSQYIKMKPEEAKEVMESDEELILVDVRTPEEYADSRIGNAINIPVEDIGDEQPEDLPDLNAKIMVYCRSGVRSKNAAEKLLDLGYKNIIDIGGIKDWPYETVPGDEK